VIGARIEVERGDALRMAAIETFREADHRGKTLDDVAELAVELTITLM